MFPWGAYSHEDTLFVHNSPQARLSRTGDVLTLPVPFNY